MSCKVLPPGDSQPDARLEWRQVRKDAIEPSEMPAWAAARLGRMERSCEERVKAASAAGRREGEALGRGQAAAETQAAMQRLAGSIEELAALRALARREAEADLIELAIAIARRVLRREIAMDPDALHGLVMGALEKLQSQEVRRVRVHPSHAALLTACLRESCGAAVEVVPDAAREPGAVVFETERGNLDASVDSQLREIERGLADRLRRRT
jgi:flagellar assembly protein FliH